jgi:hypothetical protein
MCCNSPWQSLSARACSNLLDVLLFGDREVWTPLEDYITNENYVQNT